MMPADAKPRLFDASVQAIFHDFPVPLAVIRASGELELANLAFEATYDAGHMTPDRWLQLARDSLDHWNTARLRDRCGEPTPVRVQALRIDASYLLAFEDAATGGAGSLLQELQGLRDRVRELERASATDYLTGTWNRGHLDRTIEAELSRSLRYQQPITLILIDVDHFKAINDTFGHAAGDAALRELVGRLRSSARTSDIVFRWGGEEFAVLATGTGFRAGERLAEKLRNAVAGQPFPGVGPVTISLGVAELDGNEDAAAWFHRLDQMLYSAKGQGRNRVAVDARGNSNRYAAEAGGMPLRLQWLEAYESGHPLIDRQHQRMFELTNELIDAVIGRDGNRERTDRVLNELLEHIRMHFAFEEALLERLGYEHLRVHRGAHALLLNRAIELREHATLGQLESGVLLEFLAKDVVSRHILAVDRHFFPLIAAAAKAEALPA
jgi:diguanylate cyclase (GGDEF)-like protein/hemerythrin-like metal-binding protein